MPEADAEGTGRPEAEALAAEAVGWGVDVEPAAEAGVVLGRWRSGSDLWEGWCTRWTPRPARVDAAEAAALGDAELRRIVRTMAEDAERFERPLLSGGSEPELMRRMLDLAVAGASASTTRTYQLVIGAPGAGKTALMTQGPSTGVTIQPDRLRSAHPWWHGGLGARFVFGATNRCREMLFLRSMEIGADVREEAVGAEPATLLRRLEVAESRGYTVSVTLVEADEGVLERRRLERAAVTGRLMHPASLGADPAATFAVLRAARPRMRAVTVRDGRATG